MAYKPKSCGQDDCRNSDHAWSGLYWSTYSSNPNGGSMSNCKLLTK